MSVSESDDEMANPTTRWYLPLVTAPIEMTDPRFKTEMCPHGTFCAYGEKCNFAHTTTELRPRLRSAAYKTKPCRTWAATGACPYGTRCQFMHR